MSAAARAAAIAAAVAVAALAIVKPSRVTNLTVRARRPAAQAIANEPAHTARATSRDGLASTIAAMEQRLARTPTDSDAAVALADALLRQARVTGNAGLALRAESALAAVLADEPMDFNARRMLAAVYLSQHRFREAIREATRCAGQRSDAWLYGVIGDAHIELGDYDDAFDAFERMTALRPDAASYARASYARELQGDLDGALRLMTIAADATAPQDAESLAWHHAQLGHLYLELDRPRDARREYAHAEFIFPGHPFATEGLARVDAAEGRYDAALARMQEVLAASPTPAAAAFAGELLEKLGRIDDAERQFRLAEAAWKTDAPEPSRLARFMAEHGRHLDEAVRLAESSGRRDIFTDDALAWAYFRTGRIADARAAIARALRTGSRDRAIRAHADAIARGSRS
jgi:tetratricopeptide (TPR) repeat protein